MDRRKMDVRHHFEGARDSFDQTRCTKGGKGFHELFHLDLIPLKQGRVNFELQRWGYKRAIDNRVTQSAAYKRCKAREYR